MEQNILTGLTDSQVLASQKKYGYNRMDPPQKSGALQLLLDIIREPMLILLFAISIIYLLVGDYGEALFMFFAIVAVSAISFYQDNRSKKALEALEKLNEPLSSVIRNGRTVQIPTHEISVGDLCVIHEGRMINADGKIVQSNDFSVNEASLTGESHSVFKTSDNPVYSGTVAVSGSAVFKVTHIGQHTRLGKIGTSLGEIKSEISPLQTQISNFVKKMAAIGILVFALVCVYNYVQTRNLAESLLSGLTLAMSVLPEEIPVAFTTFMAIGAWKLMQDGIIIKKSSVVETLGSTTVICTDKTGTITQNTMHLRHLYDYATQKVYDEAEFKESHLSQLIEYAMWSSEPEPFDPMEKTLHRIYSQTQKNDRRPYFSMFYEYPLDGTPPMMTHVFRDADANQIIAAKGAPEAILQVSSLSDAQAASVRTAIRNFGEKGYRVLGVAQGDFDGSEFPARQQDLSFSFLGLVVFHDPPKPGIRDVFDHIYKAGIKVKVITGDNVHTTKSIAHQAGITGVDETIQGHEILELPAADVAKVANDKVLFTRMFPEAKLAVVNALKHNGEVVAMLGDGVNDAPALKAANIGVAMGTKGTEIAKAAAALVITNDDLDKLIAGIAAGRRIYANIKKAVQYIISIHIPIILTVSLPLFLGWKFPQIFTPVHVIFLELIMGPTCSIVYENEPMEKNSMEQPPRKMTDTFLNWRELSLTIVQGLVITAGVLFAYQLMATSGASETLTRSMVFTTLIFANIFLSLTNRSFYYSLVDSFKNRNMLFAAVIVLTLLMLFAILYVTPVAEFFKVGPLNGTQLGQALAIAAVSVLWFEGYKLIKRHKARGIK